MTRVRLSSSVFALIFVGFVVTSSLQTLIAAAGLTGEARNGAIMALASAEIVSALAFTAPRWRWPAAASLVMIFGLAMALSALSGEFAPRFVYFAATALYLAGVDQGHERKLTE